MVLRVNDTDDFNLVMNLIIDWEQKTIEVTVDSWDKKKKTGVAQTFPAEEFYKAIECFNQAERQYLKGGAGC